MPIRDLLRGLVLPITGLLLAVFAAEGRADDYLLLKQVKISTLPDAVSNNAVASLRTEDCDYLASFAGLSAGRGHDDIHARTFVFSDCTGRWREVDPVPDGEGRLAAVAATIRDRMYVFGGYTVAADGSEESTPWVHAFDPHTGTFEQRTPMPVPVDDAIAVSYQDRYIYLVSGWHDLGNVNLVQLYDTKTDTWTQATPTPGPAVFGHAGGIVDGVIAYCDGVAIQPNADRRRDFLAVDACFKGIIDADDPRRIDWRLIDAHPGRPRYRMAAAGMNGKFVFVGGTENPYNYNGIGYDGEPSEPVSTLLTLDVANDRWIEVPFEGKYTMDHRGLVRFGDRWLTVGGMEAGQEVSDAVFGYPLPLRGQQ